MPAAAVANEMHCSAHSYSIVSRFVLRLALLSLISVVAVVVVAAVSVVIHDIMLETA